MMKGSSFVTLRDDTNVKSLSNNERDFVLEAAISRKRRMDGRHPTPLLLLQSNNHHPSTSTPQEIRPIQTTLSRWDNGASATVQWGRTTRVVSTVTGKLIHASSASSTTDGQLNLQVDITPMASLAFALGSPVSTETGGSSSNHIGNYLQDGSQRLLTNRILRSLERIILLGGALDTEALCVQAGQWVWSINVSTKVLDDGGNLLDASVMATMAALRHYRKPHVDLITSSRSGSTSSSSAVKILPADTREPTPLPLHHTPLTVSFALLRSNIEGNNKTTVLLLDPTDREELVAKGATVTIGMNVHGEVCLLDFSGGCELRAHDELYSACQIAAKVVPQLCQQMETTLQNADEQAMKDRLRRIQQQKQQQQQGEAIELPPLPPRAATTKTTGIPFWVEQAEEVETTASTTASSTGQTDLTTIRTTQQQQALLEEEEEEEAYRLKALDFAQGHVAARVRDDTSNKTNHNEGPVAKNKTDNNSNNKSESSTLLTAMLRSAQRASSAVGSTAATATTADATSIDIEKEPSRMEKNETKNGNKSMDMDDGNDDDEEETTMTFQSEFTDAVASKEDTKNVADSSNESTSMKLTASLPAKIDNDKGASLGKVSSSIQKKTTNITGQADNDDVDDLAMAIKSKKNKKKKKKGNK